jgi:hypothetical protein
MLCWDVFRPMRHRRFHILEQDVTAHFLLQDFSNRMVTRASWTIPFVTADT